MLGLVSGPYATIATMFDRYSHRQPGLVQQVWRSYFLQASFLPPAMLLGCALYVGVVSHLLGLPGASVFLDFIAKGSGPVTMTQVLFFAVAYATGPLCLLLSRESFEISVRHFGANVRIDIAELVGVFTPRGNGALLKRSSSRMTVTGPIRLALATTPAMAFSAAESPQRE